MSLKTSQKMSSQELQTKIRGFLEITNTDEKFVFNITDQSIVETQQYQDFITFFNRSLTNFTNSNNENSIMGSYYASSLDESDKKDFNEKVKNYSIYADLLKIRERIAQLLRKKHSKKEPIKPQKGSDFLSFTELHTYNREYHIREFMKDKDFEEQIKRKAEDILEIFEKRIEQMQTCYGDHQDQIGVTKTSDDLTYYYVEAIRERIMVDAIKEKLRSVQHLDDKEKNKILIDELQKMSGYIFWGLKDFYCYYNTNSSLKTPEELKKYMQTEILPRLKIAKENDPNCVKKMMTFLPLVLFTETKQENGETIFDYDEEKIIQFFIDNSIPINYKTGEPLPIEQGGIIKGLVSQFRLGIGYDLFLDKIGGLYSDIHSFWGIYICALDLFNSCGKYVNYSIYVNLLETYMSLINERSVFPSSFSLRKEIRPNGRNASIFNQATKSYEFRYKDPINKNNLFNEKMKLLGVIFIRYLQDKEGKPSKKKLILPLFVFKNTQFKKIPRTTTDVTTIGNDFISSYTGDERQVIICDQKMYFIEDGEIIPSISLTYHELTNILFYGAKTYMIGNDRKELYFTYRERPDPELENLIEKLKMTQVFFIKGPFKPNERERFEIKTREEANIFLNVNPQYEIMGNQKLTLTVPQSSGPTTGGNKNSNKQRKTRKNKKTRKQRKNTLKKKSLF